jgi:hypothetical protein
MVFRRNLLPCLHSVQKVTYGTTVQVRATATSETWVTNCQLTMASYPTGLNFGLHVIWYWTTIYQQEKGLLPSFFFLSLYFLFFGLGVGGAVPLKLMLPSEEETWFEQIAGRAVTNLPPVYCLTPEIFIWVNINMASLKFVQWCNRCENKPGVFLGNWVLWNLTLPVRRASHLILPNFNHLV